MAASNTCTDFLTQLTAYFERDLDPVQSLRMDRHLEACSTCCTPAAEELKRGILERFPNRDFEECMTQATLQDYRAGRITDAEELDLVRKHLAGCIRCEQSETINPQKPN